MNRALFLFAAAAALCGNCRGGDGAPASPFMGPPSSSVSKPSYQEVAPERPFVRAWKISVAPLLASQVLDSASSLGMRELNPTLANGNGQFGARSASIKIAAVGVLIGVEYLVIRRHPRAANAFTKLNWATGIVTTGFAAHNFAIR